MKRFSRVLAGLLVAVLVIGVPATAVEASWFRNLFGRSGAVQRTPEQQAADVRTLAGRIGNVADVSDLPNWPGKQLELTVWQGHGTRSFRRRRFEPGNRTCFRNYFLPEDKLRQRRK
jgi:hypothetical protein